MNSSSVSTAISNAVSNALNSLRGNCPSPAQADPKHDAPAQTPAPAGQVLKQDDQPAPEKQAEQGQKQGQEGTAGPQKGAGTAPGGKSWTDHVTSGGNQDGSGTTGAKDGYQRARGRSLPDEQKQRKKEQGRDR